MRPLCKQNAIYMILSLTLLLVLGLAILCIPKAQLHILLCDRHTHARDIFYMYYTKVAEWIPYAICVIILLFGRVGNAVMATSCIAISGLTTQILKHLIDAPRPLTWFANNMPSVSLPLVEGVEMSQYLSFPSGHTTTFFALFFILSTIITKQIHIPNHTKKNLYSALIQTICFILATLGAYSRIYLSQHFAQDIAGGIIVGLVISILVCHIFRPFEPKKWFQYRLLSKKMT